jgi:glycerophosphoryl diester phosphodiesterase
MLPLDWTAHAGLHENILKRNSKESLIKANQSGLERIEFDLFYINDQVYLAHDKKELNNKSITLKEGLDILKENNKFLHLDLKNEGLEKIVALEVRSARLEDRVLICGHDLAVLNRVDLNVKRGLSLFQPKGSSKEIFVPLTDQEKMQAALKDFLEQGKHHHLYDYLMLNHYLVDFEITKLIKNINKKLVVWTVDDQKDLLKLKGLEIESITSNLPFQMKMAWEKLSFDN